MIWLGRVVIILTVVWVYGCLIRGGEIIDFLVKHKGVIDPFIATGSWLVVACFASWAGILLWQSRKW